MQYYIVDLKSLWRDMFIETDGAGDRLIIRNECQHKQLWTQIITLQTVRLSDHPIEVNILFNINSLVIASLPGFIRAIK